MKPKTQMNSQDELFRARLSQILDRRHPLFRLADDIDWAFFVKEFGPLYVEKVGRPGLPIRLLAGLHYLKSAFNESDESLEARFLENPYWQYFCGFDYFQHELPFDSTSLVKWRKRIGPDGVEKMLAATIETAKKKKQLTENSVKRVNVDTTVQEKAIAFPTDARLYQKAREALVRAAQKRDIKLRQTYVRLGKKSLVMQGRYKHARRGKQAAKEIKKLSTYLGRVIRDIQRKCTEPDAELARLLDIAYRIHSQKRTGKNKVYSVHEPDVECIAKGKAHKKYEFGCKVSMVSTSKDNWIIGIQALHGNPYDGHTLDAALAQAERLSGWRPTEAYCDKGYRGNGLKSDTSIFLADRKKSSMKPSQWKWFKRRNAIEPLFGHLKADHRMDRNYLKGQEGDKINAILAACGFNLRKLIRAFIFWLFNIRFRLEKLPPVQLPA